MDSENGKMEQKLHTQLSFPDCVIENPTLSNLSSKEVEVFSFYLICFSRISLIILFDLAAITSSRGVR